jgi:hypothetical protein
MTDIFRLIGFVLIKGSVRNLFRTVHVKYMKLSFFSKSRFFVSKLEKFEKLLEQKNVVYKKDI